MIASPPLSVTLADVQAVAARMKIVVEPGGAAAFAALLHGKVPDIAG